MPLKQHKVEQLSAEQCHAEHSSPPDLPDRLNVPRRRTCLWPLTCLSLLVAALLPWGTVMAAPDVPTDTRETEMAIKGSGGPESDVVPAGAFSTGSLSVGDVPAELQGLAGEVQTKNLELLALQYQARSLRREAPAAGTLFDPVVSFALLNVPVDSFSLDQEAMTQKQLSVSQKLPWPGTLGLRERLALLKADEAGLRVQGLQLRLENELAADWYQLRFLGESLAVNAQLQAIVSQSLRVEESRYGTGRGLQKDLFAGQVQLSRLMLEATTLQSSARAVQARIDNLLNRNSLLEQPLPETPENRENAGSASLELPPSLPVVPDAALLAEQARITSPELRARYLAVASAELEVSLARKNYLPQFEAKLSYGQRDDNPANGAERADFLSATLAMSVPLYQTRKQDNQLAAAQIRLDAATTGASAHITRLHSEINRLLSELRGLRENYQLIQGVVIPQSRYQEEAASAAYTTAKIDFGAMLQARMQSLQTLLNAAQLRSSYVTKRAELRALVGLSLTARQNPSMPSPENTP